MILGQNPKNREKVAQKFKKLAVRTHLRVDDKKIIYFLGSPQFFTPGKSFVGDFSNQWVFICIESLLTMVRGTLKFEATDGSNLQII